MKRIDYLMMVENLKRITKTYHVYSLNFVVHPWTLPDEVKEAIKRIYEKGERVEQYSKDAIFDGTFKGVLMTMYGISIGFAMGHFDKETCIEYGTFLCYLIMKNNWEQEYHEFLNGKNECGFKYEIPSFIVEQNAKRIEERTINHTLEELKNDALNCFEPLIIDTNIEKEDER